MLKFMYGGRLEGLSEQADRLMAAAEKYDLVKLKNICETAIIEGRKMCLILHKKI